MPTPDRVKLTETFWEALEALSIKRSELVQAAKLPYTIFKPDSRVTTAQLFTLWESLQTLGGPDIGLKLTTVMHSPTLSPSFLVAFHAKNVGDALRRIARYKTLCAPEEFQITVEDNECVVSTSWTYTKDREPDALVDAIFSFIVNMIRAGTEKRITPKRMELRRSQSEYIQQWFDCSIIWNARNPRLVFEKPTLDVPFTSYNRELVAMLDLALDEELLRSKNSSSVTAQVIWHLRRALTAGRPRLRSIAREMSISARSLQRHLKAEGYSFQALLSETRHQLACEYLADPNSEISEIAYLLGYEDQGSFYRAFQDWEKRTPAEWRNMFLEGTKDRF